MIDVELDAAKSKRNAAEHLRDLSGHDRKGKRLRIHEEARSYERGTEVERPGRNVDR
jgi:hypothetical protein